MNKYNNTIELIVRLIIKKENNILLCINKKNNYRFLPGGHVEFGDSIEKTIYKEMEEELGWKPEVISNLSFQSYFEQIYIHQGDSTKHHELNMIFKAEINSSATIQAKEDHIDFEWVEIEKIDSINIKPKDIIRFIKEN